MRLHIVWFRDDFRVGDNPTLKAAADRADALLCVAVREQASPGHTWGGTSAQPQLPFERRSARRLATWQQATAGLHQQLAALGQALHIVDSVQAIAQLVHTLVQENTQDKAGGKVQVRVLTQHIPAPFEQADVRALRDAIDVLQVAEVEDVVELDSADLLLGDALAFGHADTLHKLPAVFTAFKQQVERTGMPVRALVPTPTQLPPAPQVPAGLATAAHAHHPVADLQLPEQFDGALQVSERAGQAHLQWYFSDHKAHHYKASRNGLMRSEAYGAGYATKLSPWLAKGCVSPTMVWQALKVFEQAHGATNSSYWIGFELLWREHFRWLHKRHGHAMYRAKGLTDAGGHKPPPIKQQRALFEQWSTGQTDHAFVNAGMRELALTGYVSNRMRQILASYWLNTYKGDWRIGAAWFEHALIDFDVMSNTGNWLYIAGLGSDPKGGRAFDVDWQANTYDADGAYTRRWAQANR
ncbi:DASH family cryptochrome [Comamonadaceae bacterium M7527]|nr:DASH family cryptochrome [Comamonadaceae bacterium M7527]